MKFSFSTKGWHNISFDEFLSIAKELKFEGIELHNIYNPLFTDKDGAFHDYAASATLRKLYEMKLSIPCIDTIGNIGDESEKATVINEIKKCIGIAKNLHIPFIRLHAGVSENVSAYVDNVVSVIENTINDAEENGVALLLETSGIFSNTELLRDVLERFASDSLAASLDMYSAFFIGKEDAEQIIKNLGAYVRHVHIRDAQNVNGELEPCLIGEGELPIDDMMLALRSVNYDGFFSLIWDPAWCEELDDMEIIFSQFVNYMKQYGDTSKNESTLYYNKSHTGKFVWKKDLLIDLTFPQVLDKMVEEFPDQYAFKYTTLDYTRTYSQFRDDVDTFARALISMGVKAGTKVAVWASNVPQWYIAFWATTKIGAILVTVNTAYKIH